MNTASAPAVPLRWHRPLTATGIGLAALAVFALAAMLVDDRTLMGESVWVKVFKFSFAFSAYNLTLAWLIGHMTRARRFGWWSGTAFAVISVFEVGVVAMAASLGTYSHFNTSEELSNTIVQGAFQYGVPTMFMINIVMAIVVLWQRIGDRAVTAVIRWGLLLSTLGMAAAFFILGVAEQERRVAEDAYGDPVELSAGHGVGDPDGNGMFLTGWSVTGGDLRVPHFLGLHGIQVLIVAALVLGALAARSAWLRDERVRARIVHSLGLGYLGVCVTTVWQAARGQSLIDPDAATLAAFAASAAVALIGIAVTIATARKNAPAEEQIPADFAREAEAVTDDDWEPAVPLR
ncbi:hypothetical protein [Glycomyces tenuis]|uniref:hypothetical protein n=1 Tax=Glycomyces tenuis TaxID=58116 RepID=UPI000A4FB61D|nr:hypothetical protein [Glycomyces tenuis]